MNNLFFTADQHFGHQNIIKFCNRPFKNTDEMTEELIKRHNNKVPKGARVYHLGDIFWRNIENKQAIDILYKLNGQHYFIWGNHDETVERVIKAYVPALVPIIWAKDLYILNKEDNHPRITLCHYSMQVWPGSHRGDWHLFGHSHGALKGVGKSFDVGADTNNYEPWSIEEVIVKMSTLEQFKGGIIGN
jgi:calcineurin-like phosphoesterase family protein